MYVLFVSYVFYDGMEFKSKLFPAATKEIVEHGAKKWLYDELYHLLCDDVKTGDKDTDQELKKIFYDMDFHKVVSFIQENSVVHIRNHFYAYN